MAEILFESELIKNVAKELEMDDKKIEHHLGFLKHFIKLTANKEDVHSLQLPHIGTMYRNLKGCAHIKTYVECLGKEEEYRDKMEKNEKCIQDILKKLSSFENKSLHNTKRRIHNPYFTSIKNREELEQFQNNE